MKLTKDELVNMLTILSLLGASALMSLLAISGLYFWVLKLWGKI